MVSVRSGAVGEVIGVVGEGVPLAAAFGSVAERDASSDRAGEPLRADDGADAVVSPWERPEEAGWGAVGLVVWGFRVVGATGIERTDRCAVRDLCRVNANPFLPVINSCCGLP